MTACNARLWRILRQSHCLNIRSSGVTGQTVRLSSPDVEECSAAAADQPSEIPGTVFCVVR